MADRGVGVTDQAAGAGVAEVRVRERTISAATYAEQYVIPISERVRSGVGMFTAQGLVSPAASAATVSGWMIRNPIGSTVLMAVRRIEFLCQIGSALATPTSPRLTIRRFSYTVNPTMTTVTPGKTRTADSLVGVAHHVAGVPSTHGGTITDGADLFSFLPSAAATAVGVAPPGAADWNPEEEGMVVLAAGEGIRQLQTDAGTAADTRRYVMNVAWEEYTLP